MNFQGERAGHAGGLETLPRRIVRWTASAAASADLFAAQPGVPRAAIGLGDGLPRLSTELEDPDDRRDDLATGLAAARG